jgi:hypothetical protein
VAYVHLFASFSGGSSDGRARAQKFEFHYDAAKLGSLKGPVGRIWGTARPVSGLSEDATARSSPTAAVQRAPVAPGRKTIKWAYDEERGGKRRESRRRNMNRTTVSESRPWDFSPAASGRSLIAWERDARGAFYFGSSSLSLSLSLNLDARDFLPAMAIGSMLRSRDLFTICAASNYG